ncbi:SIR2 family protein [Pedobacter sp.]|uniref:SIR2 family protein n=1 Tax=Pedobacter sp. TaxID=1411316 RepID=UPI003BAB5718
MLDKQDRHRLVELGIKLIQDKSLLNAFLEPAGIKTKNINLNGSPKVFWESVVEQVSAQNKEQAFIAALLTKFNESELKDFKDSIDANSLEKQIAHIKSMIAGRDCVLFLGPEFLTCRDSISRAYIPFNKYLSKKLAQSLMEDDIYFETNEEENLSYIINCYEQSPGFFNSMTGYTAEKIYTDGRIMNSFYHELFEMDFPLIINTNPDTIIPDFFKDRCIQGHYDQTNNPDSIFSIPSGNKKTIVYNIFGSFANPASIMFTEKQAVEFTRRAYQKQPGIPKAIREMVESSFGLFVGFDFLDWHFKILFDVLDLKHKPGNYSITEYNTLVEERHKAYYQREYNMRFLTNDIGDLLTSLK